eukprot:CAMPEP_0196743006 /NCGR_PEP_ID=MMETSP1091-20130531/50194_1 /TAXON_ID=302021 /ORGANISM="Rhodomonas sp., Strain CCMP768" /LENGTH=98 /DNA_ID=CAMNT_0042089229 /DNA_START=236 /DNA_END=532 /DNA_ORIENTATION=+
MTEAEATIDPVLIMRIPTMLAGIGVFVAVVMHMRWYVHVQAREIFMMVLGILIVATQMVFIFFASVHCPKVLWYEGELVDTNCEKNWYGRNRELWDRE